MGQFPLLDVVIGLTLIYTFLSLLASELTEFLTTLWRWRAKHLQQGIMTLLGEPLALRRNPELFKNTITGKLYHSSLIASMTHRLRRGKTLIGPAYIPPEAFADALLEVLQNLPDFEDKTQLKQKVDEPIDAFTQLMSKVENSPEVPPRLKDNLRRLTQRAKTKTADTEQQLQQFRYEIALWFEQSNARVTTLYRRHVKAFTVLLSTILAVLINADSLYMLRRISENTATRTVIIQNAGQIEGCQSDLSSPNCMNRMAFLLDSTTIPIGWHPVNRRIQFPQLSGFYVLRAVIGWLLTGIAISMGARFWFQLLSKFIDIHEDEDQLPFSDEKRQSS
jgi:hypothetical protein